MLYTIEDREKWQKLTKGLNLRRDPIDLLTKFIDIFWSWTDASTVISLHLPRYQAWLTLPLIPVLKISGSCEKVNFLNWPLMTEFHLIVFQFLELICDTET